MYIHIFVEDPSGKKVIDGIIDKIIDKNLNLICKVEHYYGVGNIPSNMKTPSEAKKQFLLNALPTRLKVFGKAFNYENCDDAVVVVPDLDDKCLKEFRAELLSILDRFTPAPKTFFCIAIEEIEAWLLGDVAAIKKAYPNAKDAVLNDYTNDSICGTWGKLADAVSSGRNKKSEWAAKITPHMDIDKNKSPSFNYFKDKLQELAAPAL